MRIMFKPSKDKTQWSNVNKNNPKFKNPKNHYFENFKENAWKMWINWKIKGKRDLQALEDKIPWRFEAEDDKKF